MADIVIRRCTFRVTRHGGWSWGADRRGLVERVTRLLPELVAARLAELLGEGARDIAEPMRLRVALGKATFANPAALKAAVEAAITAESLPAMIARPPPLQGPRKTGAADAIGQPQVDLTDDEIVAPPPSLRDLLLRWRAEGELPRRIRRFPEAAAALWLAALLDECEACGGEAPPAEDPAAEIEEIERRLSAAGGSEAQGARARLIAAVELAARHPRLPEREIVLGLIERFLPSAAEAAGEALHGPPEGDVAVAPAVRGREEEAKAAAPPPELRPLAPHRKSRIGAPEREIAISSVLPFLALGMLARIGWLDTAAATFQALNLPDRGAAFAAALAGKLLPPPERGRHRAERALATIAAFSGREAAPSPAALDAWSRTAADGLGALDGFVAFEIAAGHDPGEPLLVTRAGDAADAPWLLFDADGSYPIAFVRDEAALLAALSPFRASVLLVGRAAATPRLMRGLAAADFAFATDAPPGRGEHWVRLPGCSGCWASPGEAPPRLAAAALRIPELEAVAGATCRALVTLRPAAAPGAATALDESAALAAGLGLGLLAWTLWRDREPIEPLLALERLGDLDGSVRIATDALEVRPAIGRRYLDLKAKGVLASVAGVPWLGGRLVRFVGP